MENQIVVVGVCTSGKSTLKDGLRRLGYSVDCVAQEHTLVKKLWRRSSPDVLIVLNCRHSTIQTRRANPNWPRSRYDQQRARLSDARQHADIVIETDDLSPNELVERAHKALGDLGVGPWGAL